jgi:hypothetical protein
LIEQYDTPDHAIFGPHVPKKGVLDEKPSLPPFTTDHVCAKIVASHATGGMKTATKVTARLTGQCGSCPLLDHSLFAFITQSRNK